MPSTTVFCTSKLAFSELPENFSVLSLPSRVAASISTSAGEFTRVTTSDVENVGAPEVRATSESRENT